MAKHRWNYNGDGNLRAGGFYWREDGAEDYVLAVRVTPCPSAGGPSNLFHIESGSIYLPPDPAKRKIALGCCGYAFETATRSEIVDAFMSYCGIDGGDETVIRIGPPDPFFIDRGDAWNPEPDTILRANRSLERYVRNTFLD
jgi:hypothetical protein